MTGSDSCSWLLNRRNTSNSQRRLEISCILRVQLLTCILNFLWEPWKGQQFQKGGDTFMHVYAGQSSYYWTLTCKCPADRSVAFLVSPRLWFFLSSPRLRPHCVRKLQKAAWTQTWCTIRLCALTQLQKDGKRVSVNSTTPNTTTCAYLQIHVSSNSQLTSGHHTD